MAQLTLVADPDRLLLEEECVFAVIRERGIELIPFEVPIAFWYAYESRFRSRWDQGEQTDWVVVLHSAASDLNCLPYDLFQTGHQLSFNLDEIFPSLSYPIVTALDRGDLDALYEAQKRHAPGVLGDNATKEFVLRDVFRIAPELIRKPSDRLRVLLKEFEEYRESKQRRLNLFRLEAVRAGFKKAWQERDYDTIISVARKIPDNILPEDTKLLMWYDQAVTRTGE